MTISIFIDAPNSIVSSTLYVIDNIFFPISEDVRIVHDFDLFTVCDKKVLYCQANSKYLTQETRIERAMVIVLDDWTISYFSRLTPYDIHRISWIQETPCLFPTPITSCQHTHPTSRQFPFDFFSASFFFLSCYQELVVKDRDAKGRVPLSKTLQYQLGRIRVPIVNQYLRIFLEAVSTLWECKFDYKPMPNGGNAFCAMSHDVDYIDCSATEYIRRLVNQRQSLTRGPKSLAYLGRNAFGRKYVFSMMKNVESAFGVRSTNFFLSNYSKPPHRSFTKKLISGYQSSSCEIGHHISDRSIFEESLIADKNRFSTISSSLCGARVHTLRFETQRLFQQLEAEGYQYDSSLLFAEDIGYRTGFTYPHYLFDFSRQKPFNVVEVPLNIMDTTLVDQKYLMLSDQEAERLLIDALRSFISFGGGLTILIHNSFFYINTPGRLKMYERLFQFLTEQGVGIGTCEQLYNWRV